MRLIASVVFAASLLAAGSAFAQAETPIDPAKLELARKLVEASGGQKNAETMVRQTYGSLDTVFAKMGTPETQRLMRLVQRDMQDEIIKMIPAILEMSTNTYARHLTEKELADMLAFQTSETGRSVAAKLPAIMQDIVKAQTPLLQEMLPRLLHRTLDRACEEAKCSTAEREQVATMMKEALKPKAS